MSGATDRRRLGLPTLSGLVVANMIGAGIFTTSGFALGDLGTPGRVMAAWALGGAIALLGVICYGALAARLRESGGEYLFMARTLHPFFGFLAGWISLLAGFGGAVALAAEALQAYVVDLLPPGVRPDVIGTIVIVGAGVLHAAGVRLGALTNNAVVVLKLVALLVITVGGLALLGARGLGGATATPAGTGDLLAPFIASLMWISLSFSGWNAAVYVAGEARNAERNVPRAMLLGTLLVTVLYLALNFVFVYAAPVDTLAGQPAVARVAAEALAGPAAGEAVRVVMAMAMLTSVASMTMIGPRVTAKMAVDGLLPGFLRYAGDAPRAAIFLQVLVAVAFLWLAELREMLGNLGWLLSLCTAAAVVGLIRLRLREGAERVPVTGWPWIPLLFVAVTLGLTGTMLFVRGLDLIPALVVLGTGVLAYRALPARAAAD